MYTALYRSQRPEVFSDILGQEHIVRILQYQVSTNTTSHAYVFCGTRGTGKTSTARILAKAVNCLAVPEPMKTDASGAMIEGDGRPCGRCANCLAIKNGTFLDVVEIDAASNNSVENIRDLRESVKFPPAVGRKKVYIIDEVHMLSAGASNALLKTLEEPPENVMFILATTEPQKILPTILSRCMRLDFKRVPQQALVARMQRIAEARGVEITEEALQLVAGNADGSVRDCLSLLDQVMAGGDRYIDRDRVLAYIGTAGEDFFIDLTEAVEVHKAAEALVLVDRALADGKDARQLMRDCLVHYRNLMLTKFVQDPEDMINTSLENIRRIRAQSQRIDMEHIDGAIRYLSGTISEARDSTQPRILLELAVVALASGVYVDAGGQMARRWPDAAPRQAGSTAPAGMVPPAGPAGSAGAAAVKRGAVSDGAGPAVTADAGTAARHVAAKAQADAGSAMADETGSSVQATGASARRGAAGRRAAKSQEDSVHTVHDLSPDAPAGSEGPAARKRADDESASAELSHDPDRVGKAGAPVDRNVARTQADTDAVVADTGVTALDATDAAAEGTGIQPQRAMSPGAAAGSEGPAARERADDESASAELSDDPDRAGEAGAPTGCSAAKSQEDSGHIVHDLSPDAPADRSIKESQPDAGDGGDGEVPTEDGAAEPSLLDRRELDVLWRQIFEEGEGSATSFNLIRAGTTLQTVTASQFVVQAKTSFAEKYAEKMRPELERLMERHTGRRLHMVCVAAAQEGGGADVTEVLAKRVEEVLGVPVEIEP